MDWKPYKLEDLVEIKHGFAFKGEFFSDVPSENVLLTPGNFHIGGGFKSDKFKYYLGDYSNEYVLRTGDLIVTMTDLSKAGDTLGYVAKVPAHVGVRYLHNQRLGLIQFKTDEVDKDFIYWLLRTRKYQRFVLGSATGSTVKHTSPSRIRAFEFLAPESKKEQQKIAQILSSFDDKIELNRRMNTTLEEMARAIFKAWFVDSEPVHANKEGRPSQSASPEIAELFPSEFENGIPKGWRQSTIGAEVQVVGGSTPSTKETSYWNGPHKWVTPKDLSNLQERILIQSERTITAEGLATISSGELPINTVLLSSRAPVGYLALTKIPVSINQGFIAMKCNGTLSPSFVLQWSEHSMDKIKNRASGTTFAEISKANFRPLPVIVPGEKIIESFEAIAGPIYELIASNCLENKTLGRLRDELLPRLISGKLRVES